MYCDLTFFIQVNEHSRMCSASIVAGIHSVHMLWRIFCLNAWSNNRARAWILQVLFQNHAYYSATAMAVVAEQQGSTILDNAVHHWVSASSCKDIVDP